MSMTVYIIKLGMLCQTYSNVDEIIIITNKNVGLQYKQVNIDFFFIPITALDTFGRLQKVK